MIIILNGYPGVGKLAIGRALAQMLDARLLDIHSVYNVAFALTEFRSTLFRQTVEKIEAIAHDLIRALPTAQPVVLTTVLAGDSQAGIAEWHRMTLLAKERPPLAVVHVGCDRDENMRRIQSAERDQKRKPRDPDMARRNQDNAQPLLGTDAEHFLMLDTTDMTAQQAAERIFDWVSGI